MPDVLRINNAVFSWNSCSFSIDAQPYTGLTAIKNGQKRERAKVWGMNKSGKPLGRTRGHYEADPVEITFLEDTWDALSTYLLVKGLGSVGDAEVTGLLKISELGKTPIIILMEDLVTTAEGDDKKEGAEPNTIVVTFDCMRIMRNLKPFHSLGLALL